jgi:6-phosphogluconate dehydrogenase
MRFGIVGLGRMGANLARQAIEKGHQVVGYDPSAQARQALSGAGVEASSSLEELATKLKSPRVILLYVPHGDITEQVCQAIRPVLAGDDIVMDGGNSHWKDSERRYGFFSLPVAITRLS